MYVGSAFLFLFLLFTAGRWLSLKCKWKRHAKAQLPRDKRKQEAAASLAKRMSDNAAKRERSDVKRETKAAKKAKKLAVRVSAAEEAKQDAGDCGASEKENLRTMPQSVGGKEPANQPVWTLRS